MSDRSLDWLRQAQDNLKFAQESLKLGHFNQICFICQQAEDCLKKAKKVLERASEEFKQLYYLS